MEMKSIFLSLSILINAESNFEHRKISKNLKNFENLERFGENFELFVECTKILSEKMDGQQAANICTDVHQKSPPTVSQKFKIIKNYVGKLFVMLFTNIPMKIGLIILYH